MRLQLIWHLYLILIIPAVCLFAFFFFLIAFFAVFFSWYRRIAEILKKAASVSDIYLLVLTTFLYWVLTGVQESAVQSLCKSCTYSWLSIYSIFFLMRLKPGLYEYRLEIMHSYYLFYLLRDFFKNLHRLIASHIIIFVGDGVWRLILFIFMWVDLASMSLEKIRLALLFLMLKIRICLEKLLHLLAAQAVVSLGAGSLIHFFFLFCTADLVSLYLKKTGRALLLFLFVPVGRKKEFD